MYVCKLKKHTASSIVWCCFWSSCCYFHGKEKGWKWMGLIPTSKDDFTEEILFFLLAQLASLSSASSSFYSTSFLFFSFFFSSFACHIFKEASPCQNCQLLLHKLCPSQIWQKIEKDSRFWNVMHQCIIRLNSWHTNMMDRYLYFYVWMLDFVYFIKFVYCLCTCKQCTTDLPIKPINPLINRYRPITKIPISDRYRIGRL